jgi:UDP-glucose 4-epimerase
MSEVKKAVVTGGAGFIGSNLAEELVRRGYHVIILDDLSSGRVENIEQLLENDKVKFIKGSITDLSLLRKSFHNVDYVFHLAANPSVPASIENPLLCHETNVTGTLNVLLAARDSSVKKVVYASSCAVYGDTASPLKREEMAPNPQSPYAATKLASEYYCHVFHQVYGLPTVCLRYFNVYGPRQDPYTQYAAVIPKFTKSVCRGNPPIIFGDGEQTRDFIFVEDVVEANIWAAGSSSNGVFNIGRGEKIALNELARLIINIMGKNMEPIHQEPRPGDIRHSLADIAKARTLGYTPNHTLIQGLKKTIGEQVRAGKRG